MRSLSVFSRCFLSKASCLTSCKCFAAGGCFSREATISSGESVRLWQTPGAKGNPMDAVQAEAALLALADLLVWGPGPGARHKSPWLIPPHTSMCAAFTRERGYCVQIKGRWFCRWYWASYGCTPPAEPDYSKTHYRGVFGVLPTPKPPANGTTRRESGIYHAPHCLPSARRWNGRNGGQQTRSSPQVLCRR